MNLLEILTTAEKMEAYLNKIRPEGSGTSNVYASCVYVEEMTNAESHNEFTHTELEIAVMKRLVKMSKESKIINQYFDDSKGWIDKALTQTARNHQNEDLP